MGCFSSRDAGLHSLWTTDLKEASDFGDHLAKWHKTTPEWMAKRLSTHRAHVCLVVVGLPRACTPPAPGRAPQEALRWGRQKVLNFTAAHGWNIPPDQFPIMKNQNLSSKTLSIIALLPVRKQYPTEAHGRIFPNAREDCGREEMDVK